VKGNLKHPLVLLSYMGRGAQKRQQVYVSLYKFQVHVVTTLKARLLISASWESGNMTINFWHVLVCCIFLSECQPENGFFYLVFGCFTKCFLILV